MKKILFFGLIIICVSFIINSCQKEIHDDKIPGQAFSEIGVPVSDGETFTATVLGDQLHNPYHIDTMQQALENLLVNAPTLNPSHRYVRYLPSTIWQYVGLLNDTTLTLYDYPLDYEILSIGDYYQEPGIDIEDFTWLYTAVPYSKVFGDSLTTNYLASLFIPEDSLLIFNNDTILADDLIEEAFNLCGYDWGTDPTYKQSLKITRKTKYYPSGTIQVKNTLLGNKPVKNAMVICRHWFSIRRTYTNSSGQFSISKGFRGKVNIAVYFKNSNVTIRGIRGVRMWQIADAVYAPIGVYRNSSMTNMSYTFKNTPTRSSEKKRRWVAATACTQMQEYRVKALSKGINLPPSHTNMWLSSFGTMAGAPMLKSMQNKSFLSICIDVYLWTNMGPVPVVIKRILGQYLPDYTIGYNHSEFDESDQADRKLNHEVGHSSHYTQVGSVYWQLYFGHLAINNGGYDPNDPGYDLIMVTEGWAFYIANLLAHEKYGQLTTVNYPFTYYLEENSAYPDIRPWTPGAFYYDLTDDSEPTATGIVDNADAYNTSQIFDALLNTVSSPVSYKNLLLTQNGNLQVTQVNALFSSYNF